MRLRSMGLPLWFSNVLYNHSGHPGTRRDRLSMRLQHRAHAAHERRLAGDMAEELANNPDGPWSWEDEY